MNTDLEKLRAGFAKLPATDQAFALSLLAQEQRKGGLSEKQWPWVTKLAARIDAAAEGPPAAPQVLGDLTALRAMFAAAAMKRNFPHLLLHRKDGETLKVWIAGARASAPGTVTVVGARSRTWFGRIKTDGTWAPGAKPSEAESAGVAALLCELVKAPAETLAANGKEAGACCYCGVELTDDRSVEAGYGPTCAKKWGLPWGRKES